jgi:protease II
LLPSPCAAVNYFFVLTFLLGTRYLDDNWFYSGVGSERKHVHIEDLIDSAIFLKENSLADKIALFSSGYSGSHAALAAVTQEPYLFHGATFHVSLKFLTLVKNPICDLPSFIMHDIQNRDKLKR